jgi:hypothetical protein
MASGKPNRRPDVLRLLHSSDRFSALYWTRDIPLSKCTLSFSQWPLPRPSPPTRRPPQVSSHHKANYFVVTLVANNLELPFYGPRIPAVRFRPAEPLSVNRKVKQFLRPHPAKSSNFLVIREADCRSLVVLKASGHYMQLTATVVEHTCIFSRQLSRPGSTGWHE